MKIDTAQAFGSWLSENFWLHDAVVDALEPLPDPAGRESTPASVRLLLSMQIGGSYRAGQERRIRQLEIIARGVSQYSLSDGGSFTAGHRSEGAAVFLSAHPIALKLDVPGVLRLACEVLEVAQTERAELVPPWLSPREFSASARGHLPTPAQWTGFFTALGLPVTWRYYAGPSTEASHVPDDYAGWFMQMSERVSATTGGLFIRTAEQRGSAFVVTAENHDEEMADLWVVAGTMLGAFAHARISCGNVELPGDQWTAHLLRMFPNNPYLIALRQSGAELTLALDVGLVAPSVRPSAFRR